MSHLMGGNISTMIHFYGGSVKALSINYGAILLFETHIHCTNTPR